ncbi:MAG: type secretion system protein [Verrucomicrobiales bacterium]|jgi:type II secretion system protein H|nr:type secretion system protein [Verrucomicrobiales bacterium]
MMTLPIGKIKSKGEPAFTLIELILVMAILLVVLAVAAPSLSNFFKGRTLDSESRRIVALTRYGQERAVSEGVPMVLWMDIKRDIYGLRQETGYTVQDVKAVEYDLGKDLKMEVTDVPKAIGQTAVTRQNRNADATLPVIRFQPDGFIDETSPQTIILREATGETVWISKSRNQLNYAVQTNRLLNAMR